MFFRDRCAHQLQDTARACFSIFKVSPEYWRRFISDISTWCSIFPFVAWQGHSTSVETEIRVVNTVVGELYLPSSTASCTRMWARQLTSSSQTLHTSKIGYEHNHSWHYGPQDELQDLSQQHEDVVRINHQPKLFSAHSPRSSSM